ncbi:leucine-rich repeats and immunoglobulin-like domains protein 2 isoform X2 [Stegostoma tigrinum]|uniref:leucine-rich repeats and immunoglobulin-like domains protein 2 isoform X2 n=1 Tax=Stegostoma tigrinum TaxID=3053191 RepID=UPI00202BA06C|nr:leucine-rich repeats and immunoglobulin-like domains protein 2 isoform X2 [Stegostoma tigrinum]
MAAGPGLAPRLFPAVLLLAAAVAAASSSACPPQCSCDVGLVDCSRGQVAAIPQQLPAWIKHLDLSHNRLVSTKDSVFEGLHTLLEVNINYNLLSTIPTLGAVAANITVLSLTHNQLTEIIAEDLLPYSALETLDLSSNLISEIKTSSFPIMQLKNLHLNNNRITVLEPGCFDNLSNTLLVLKLNRNKITVIQPKSFRLPQLQYLELKRNRIRIVESLTFHGLDSLKSLKLQCNGICELKDGAFWGLNEITELDLEHNNLTEVTKGWLYGLKLLQHLHLSQNAITRVSADAWEFCQKLTELDMTYNQMTRLDESTFVGLNLLESLYMGDNRVSYIADGVFSSLSNLLTLDLRNNKISWAIEDSHGVFTGLVKLRKLILQGSKITSITKKAFSGLETLEYLDLSNNAIMSIQENSFAQMSLKELGLNTSSLLCDCQLKWLPQFLKEKQFQHTVTANCAHPVWLAGKNIFNVDAEDFICDAFPKPLITAHPETTVALRGMNVSFSCTACSSSDSPMAAVWRKDRELLYEAEIQNYSSLQEQDGEFVEYTTVLQLRNVNFTDEGWYQCVITNYFGSNYSNKAELTVNELPSFMKTPMDLTIRTGAMARLECAAGGHPMPQIAWQKDGGTDFPAARERRMHVMPEDDVFFIVNVKMEDMGMYSCMAQNTAGGISANATLTVLDEMNLPADIPSYLSSQGTLSEPQEGYSNSEAGSHQQLMASTTHGYVHKGTDGICYVDTGSETDADLLTTPFGTNLHGRMGSLYAGRSSFHPSEPREGLAQQVNPGGTSGPLVICSDCYDNANIYSKNREYCPYTFLAEEDPQEHALTGSFAVHTQHEGTAIDSLVTEADVSVSLTNHDRIRNPASTVQLHRKESCPRPPWSSSTDSGHSHYSQQPVTIHKNPQAFLQGDDETEDGAEPPVAKNRLSQRSLEQSTGNERTLAMQAHGATT